MYAMVDIREGTYAACTPTREGDDPARLGLDTATLPGGWYLRARITGEPPGLYERIDPAMQALEALAVPADPGCPLIEYYRRHDEIELWVPHSCAVLIEVVGPSRPGTAAAAHHSRQLRIGPEGAGGWAGRGPVACNLYQALATRLEYWDSSCISYLIQARV
jgi:hypothetical protein